MLTKLKQSAWGLVATVALSTAAFSVLPNAAEAQDMSSVADAQGDNELLAPQSMVVAEEPASAPATHATAVIVNPGDSLWSIVQERLHPEAPPQQVAFEVNRLYELNQDRIGGDPNLIFPGQEFLVPPAVMAEPAAPAVQPQTGWGSPASEEPAAAAAAASPALSAEEPVTAEPAASEDLARSEGPATPVEPSTPQPVASEEPATPEQVTEPVNEPAAPSNTAPTDEETASPLAGIVDPLIDFYDNHKGGERQLLGVGILVLTALVAILMAWRLPMKRSVDSPTAWGIPGGYYQEERPPAADGGVEEDHKPDPASGAPEPTSRRGPSDPTATEASKPASDNGSEESPPYPSLAARRRQERLRRIRQRTLNRPTRRAPERREG